MPKNKREPIPKHFAMLEEAGAFWDTHDLGEYWDQTEEVAMTFHLKRRRHLLAIDPGLAQSLQTVAIARGVRLETIANLWLREMLAKEQPSRKRKALVRKAA
jgi:hypothetical protein